MGWLRASSGGPEAITVAAPCNAVLVGQRLVTKMPVAGRG